MKKQAFFLTVVLAATVFGRASAYAFSVSFEQRVRSPKDGQLYTGQVRMKDDKMRIEQSAQGMRMVMLRNEQGMFNYMPDNGMAMKIPELQFKQQAMPQSDDYLGYLEQLQAKKVGSEKIRSYECDIYLYTDPEDGAQVKVWVWTKGPKPFPVQIERAGKDGTLVFEVDKVKFDAPMDDSLFRLPEGVQVMDMGSLGGILGGKGGKSAAGKAELQEKLLDLKKQFGEQE